MENYRARPPITTMGRHVTVAAGHRSRNGRGGGLCSMTRLDRYVIRDLPSLAPIIPVAFLKKAPNGTVATSLTRRGSANTSRTFQLFTIYQWIADNESLPMIYGSEFICSLDRFPCPREIPFFCVHRICQLYGSSTSTPKDNRISGMYRSRETETRESASLERESPVSVSRL